MLRTQRKNAESNKFRHKIESPNYSHKKLKDNSYRFLPDTFSLSDIRPLLNEEKYNSIQKLYKLWRSGVPLHIYGSFVSQCGLHLIGKRPTVSKDIDAASDRVDLKDLPDVITKLALQGFTPKKPEETQTKIKSNYPITYYGFECNDDNTNIDFTLRLPDYVGNPNALVFSSFTLNFTKKNSREIFFTFDNNKSELEQYCNLSRYQIVKPDQNERSVMRRVLKQIKQNRELYDNHDLHMYYKRFKVENFSADDKGWNAFTQHMKSDFKRKFGKKKFLAYYNEFRRMIKEGTFFMPEAALFIKNFCEVILEHHNQDQYDDENRSLEKEADIMASVLQQYFAKNVKEANKFHDKVTELLRYSAHLTNKNPEIVDVLAFTLGKSKYKHSTYSPRLFTPKLIDDEEKENMHFHRRKPRNVLIKF